MQTVLILLIKIGFLLLLVSLALGILGMLGGGLGFTQLALSLLITGALELIVVMILGILPYV